MALSDNLEALLARGQDNALLRYGLGAEYAKQNQHARAIPHLQQAVAHDPSYSAAWKLLGQSLAASGDHAAAMRAYADGIRAAETKGDKQAAKEMTVFLKRLQKAASQ